MIKSFKFRQPRKSTLWAIGFLTTMWVSKIGILDWWLLSKGHVEMKAGRLTQWQGFMGNEIGKKALFYKPYRWDSEAIRIGVIGSPSRKDRFLGLAFLGWQERDDSISWLRSYTDDRVLVLVANVVRVGLELGINKKQFEFDEYESYYLGPAMKIALENPENYEEAIQQQFKSNR